jgi:protein-disulfide isomerase
VKKLLVVVALVVVVAGFWYAAKEVRARRAARFDFMAQENAATFVRPHSPVKGPRDAKVYVVEFSDPACETCAAFGPILDDLLARHPGKVKLVVRWVPFHEGADRAVRVLEAARMQGKLWETLALLYRNLHVWTQHHQVVPEGIWQLLEQANPGLDLDRIRADLDDPGITAAMEQDMADARTLGVRRTPGIFVNGKPLEPFGVEPLAALIAAEVKAAYPD